jgi:hypothetical protein
MHAGSSKVERDNTWTQRTLAFFPLLLLEVLSFKVQEDVVDRTI